jgi:hypothetical protein
VHVEKPGFKQRRRTTTCTEPPVGHSYRQRVLIGSVAIVPVPSWWDYPRGCPAGHPWGPGRVIVGWMPCDCHGVFRHPGRGHLWVKCGEQTCTATWYRPRHGDGLTARSTGRGGRGLTRGAAPGRTFTPDATAAREAGGHERRRGGTGPSRPGPAPAGDPILSQSPTWPGRC